MPLLERRAFRFLLVLALCLLFLIFFLSSSPPPRNTRLNVALDAVLKRHPEYLSISASFQTIRAVQDSLASKPIKSPRDFRLPPKYTSSHLARACTLLRAKRILLVGPETTYYLHTLWLNALEAHEHRNHECPGLEFCSFHHICLPSAYTTPHGRFKPPPKDTELVASGSAVMRYVLSTSLYASQDKMNPAYTQPVVDPATGVRQKNACWIHKARKSDISIFNRGPVPAPAWTYVEHKSLGNWSFASDLPRHLGPGKTLAMEIINAAFHVTVTRFLPEVLESLHTIQMDQAMRRKLVVWHPSWVSRFMDLENLDSVRQLDDPWELYYNAQVYMQNYLLRKTLPFYGVHLLPRIAPSMLADSQPAGRDSLRFPLGTANAHEMETSFLESLIELLERAN
ncbi:hypothetical protein B0H15DRAFT_790083 [Mycena belliarum]|uniref:Uncharacterized protein n=1 Tax=Mycena belliarum TaxID=1033014 RepID=A0AAD6TWN3_9AGAR|nr:hypothetical protein B0H15DRAFT_790083 [Mycena belliae]